MAIVIGAYGSSGSVPDLLLQAFPLHNPYSIDGVKLVIHIAHTSSVLAPFWNRSPGSWDTGTGAVLTTHATPPGKHVKGCTKAAMRNLPHYAGLSGWQRRQKLVMR